MSAAIIVAPCAMAIPTEAASMPFNDIKNGGSEAELYKAVQELYSKGIVFGTTNTMFSPYQSLTRGEAAYFFSKSIKFGDKESRKSRL